VLVLLAIGAIVRVVGPVGIVMGDGETVRVVCPVGSGTGEGNWPVGTGMEEGDCPVDSETDEGRWPLEQGAVGIDIVELELGIGNGGITVGEDGGTGMPVPVLRGTRPVLDWIVEGTSVLNGIDELQLQGLDGDIEGK